MCAFPKVLQGAEPSVLLHLRNGDRVSGVVVGEQPGQVTISNAVLGKITVPVAQIERRTTNVTVVTLPAPAGNTNKANPVGGAPAAKPSGVPATALVNPAVAPKPSIATPPPLKVATPKIWTGEALVGADLAYSERDRQLYTGRLKLIYAQRPIKSTLDYLATYGLTESQPNTNGETRSELSANRMDATLKTDLDLTRKLYVFGLLGGGYDEIRKVDWRYEISPGVGQRLLRMTNIVLNVEVGASYQVNNFQEGLQDEFFHYRLAQDFKWNIGTMFTFDEKVEYLPQWNEPKEFKLRLEANLRYWLRANLSLNLTVINIYDTVTARQVDQNDLQVRSSIGVKF